MFIKVTALGRLTKDIELRYTQSGTPVGKTSIATDVGYGDKKETTFTEVEMWNKLAENSSQYLKKGSLVFIEGILRQSSWENKDGERRSKHFITASIVKFIDKKSEAENRDVQTASTKRAESTPRSYQAHIQDDLINDEEPPF